MKKITTLILLILNMLSFGQPDRENMRKKIKVEKIAFITQQLDLSADEAEKFWPIFNTFEASTKDIKKTYLRQIRQKLRIPFLSDSSRVDANISVTEADKLLDNLIIAENKTYKAKIKLVNDLKSAIPVKKIIKLKMVEEAFNRKLLERLKKFRVKRNKY